MKKVLACLAAVSLIVPSAASVVSCGPKVSDHVVFVLPGLAMSSASKITRSYQQIVDDFNQSEIMKDSKVKVEVAWENGDAIQQRASGLEPMPDLYVAYPDLVARYALDPSKRDFVRDMEETYTGSLWETNHGQTFTPEMLKQNFWAPSFYEEGLISNDPTKSLSATKADSAEKLYVLPLNKSFDMSVVNLKVFLELASFVLEPNDLRKLGSILDEITPSELFVHESSFQVDPQIKEPLFEALQLILGAETKVEADRQVRAFFRNGEKILLMAEIYAMLYQNHLSPKIADYTRVETNIQKMFAVGIDSTANQIFMNYADQRPEISDTGVSAINPYIEENFFYQIKGMKPEKERMDVYLDNPEAKIFQEISRYFNTFAKLAQMQGHVTNGDPVLRWAGALMIGRLDNKTYTTNYFNQGTMLVSSSSTAGSWSIGPDNPERPQFDKTRDLLVVAGPTMSGQQENFIQQGPGLAGFKSIGRTASLKEEVTTKFVRYLLEPKVQNKLAIMSGYIPSTKEALEIFRHYKDGSFDNETGTWRDGSAPKNQALFEQIAEPRTENYSSQEDLIISQLLEEYANLEQGIKMNVVTTSANPAGSLVRDAIESALRTYVFKDLAGFEFENLLKPKDKAKPWKDRKTIPGQLHNFLPGSLSSSKIYIK